MSHPSDMVDPMTKMKRHHVSNSEIQAFKRCRRKWWLTYYRKLRPVREKNSGALRLGTNVHAALEAMYSLEPQDPIEVIRNLYEAERTAALEIDDHEGLVKINKDGDLAMAMIEGYVQWVAETGVDDDLDVFSVEEEISVDLEAVPVTLIGKLDTRVRRRSDGRILSMDHKTAISIDDLVRQTELLEQPMMYQLLERLNAPEGEHVTGGVYNILRKVKRTGSSKPPFYHREYIHHNDHELRSFWKRIHGVLRDMVTVHDALDNGADPANVAYPTPTKDCSWDCDFRAICPMFDDGSHVEGIIESAYKIHDPYQRYEMETE